MTLVDPRPLVPHPYRPLNGMPQAPYGAWLRTWAEAEFLDASRWRDIVYFLILVPLALLEFVVSVGLWVTRRRAAPGVDRPRLARPRVRVGPGDRARLRHRPRCWCRSRRRCRGG